MNYFFYSFISDGEVNSENIRGPVGAFCGSESRQWMKKLKQFHVEGSEFGLIN